MRLTRAIAKNFITYKSLDYSFKNSPILVQGQNLSDDSQETNGVGKTGLQTVIEYCIAASNSRGERDCDLITYGQDMANLQLYAECDVRKERVHIDWDLKIKGANVLRFKRQKYGEETWTPIPFAGVPDGKNKVIEWFGISKDDLFNYFIINKKRFKSFFESSNTEKVSLINRFSDASLIDGIDDVDTSEFDKKYTKLKTDFDSSVGKIDLIKEQIEEQKNRDFERELSEAENAINVDISDIQEEIDDIKESIITTRKGKKGFEDSIQEQKDLKKDLDLEKTNLDKRVSEIESELKKVNKDLSEAKILVDKFVSTNWDKKRESHNTEISGLKKSNKEVAAEKEKDEEQQKKIVTLLKSIENTLSGVIICPKCSHEFLLDEEADVVSLRERQEKGTDLKKKVAKKIESKESVIDETKDKIKKIELKLSEINKEEQTENSNKNALVSSLNKINKSVNEVERNLSLEKAKYSAIESKEEKRLLRIKNLKSDIDNIEVKVESKEKEISSYEREIETLQASKANLKVNSNEIQIKALKDDLLKQEKERDKFSEEHSKVGDEIYKLNQWSKNFKQFKMHLANQSLEIIEYHCNRYLKEMGSDLLVKLEGFKVNANGTVKEEIGVTVIRNANYRTYTSYSGGEKGRLLFAAILANRYMINETHPYGGLDFLYVDEVFEGLDSVGIVSLLNSAKLLNMPVLLVTHVVVERSSDVITIVKENDISTIQYE